VSQFESYAPKERYPVVRTNDVDVAAAVTFQPQANVACCSAGQATPVSLAQVAQPSFGRTLLTVRDSAVLLGVSQSWVRRHLRELPTVRVGRLVRFDSALLRRQFQGKYTAGNRLKPEGVKHMSLRLRRYQRGYVYKIGKKIKVWYGMFREDIRQPDGRVVRRQRNVRLGTLSEFPTRSAAYEELARRMGEQQHSVGLSFSVLVERWKAVVVPTLRNTTAVYYTKMLKAHVLPAFGEKEISSIGRYDVEAFLAERAKMYCRNTLRGMRVSLGRALSWAVACGWLEKNPCAGVKLPHAGKRIKRTILKPEETIAIANRLDEPYSTLILFLAVSGLRISEAIGIKWTDFEGDVLRISRRIYEGKAGSTKNDQSERSLPIPVSLLTRMRLLGNGEWVFRSRTGTPINPGNALKRYVRPVVKDLGIEIGGWHDFRHTLVTRSLKKWPTKVISEMVGHSDVHTTLRVYQHIETDDFRAPLNELADELLRDVTKSSSALPCSNDSKEDGAEGGS
jgi:integrase